MTRDRDEWRRVPAAGLTYFAVVMAAGVGLGVVREVLVAPAIGPRVAELAEYPVMLAIVVLAGRWRARAHRLGGAGPRMAAGGLAVACLLATEQAMIVAVRGVSPADFYAARPWWLNAMFLAAMAVMAAAPLAAGRHATVTGSGPVRERTSR